MQAWGGAGRTRNASLSESLVIPEKLQHGWLPHPDEHVIVVLLWGTKTSHLSAVWQGGIGHCRTSEHQHLPQILLLFTTGDSWEATDTHQLVQRIPECTCFRQKPVGQDGQRVLQPPSDVLGIEAVLSGNGALEDGELNVFEGWVTLGEERGAVVVLVLALLVRELLEAGCGVGVTVREIWLQERWGHGGGRLDINCGYDAGGTCLSSNVEVSISLAVLPPCSGFR